MAAKIMIILKTGTLHPRRPEQQGQLTTTLPGTAWLEAWNRRALSTVHSEQTHSAARNGCTSGQDSGERLCSMTTVHTLEELRGHKGSARGARYVR